MMLRSIDFVQSENKPLEWRLERLALQQINLVVGKNACGKSRTLRAIGNLARFVSGTMKPGARREQDVSYIANFAADASGAQTAYTLKIVDSRITEEMLRINGADKIVRGAGGAGHIYFDKLAQFLEFQTPEDELASVNRRDSIQHPYLDELHGWGQASFYYRFNSLDLGKLDIVSFRPVESPDKGAHPSSWPVHLVYKIGAENYANEFKSSVLVDMRRLGYPLTDIVLRSYDGVPKELQDKGMTDPVCLCIAEEGLADPVDQFNMSDGMFRALSIIMRVNHAAISGQPSCVIIDDIGEGLDYERSCILIELLIEKAKSAGVQLVMATNDRFVMNSVPLEYWTVLSRGRAAHGNGTQVKVYNYETHKKTFDEFAYTGLNNFDFLATRFFEEGLDERE
ncbi:AAA family ATPase [Sorangium sp. So ce590]|uniref:AAA family ATPase n=1 Tax=Sorangium sp. So ce590 TaxID=3133317 RepID=UPI003F63121D